MNEFSTVLSAVLPIFGLMAAGLGLRKLNWLTEDADNSLLRINVNVLLPCLIFDSALGNPALSQMRNLLLAPTFGYATVVLGIGLALVSRALHGLSERSTARTFAVCVGIYNYGYIPLPLVLLLFDKATTGVLFLVMMGVETALWTLGVDLPVAAWESCRISTHRSLPLSWRWCSTRRLNAHLPRR
jgi:predicted permease